MMKKSNRGSVFVNIVSTIGAVLIFIGIAWLIAKNWHQIPNPVKVIILVFATLISFISGVFARQNEHEGAGRALIVLGALLYIVSVFLIAQIYATPTGLQGYAWLLLLCWPVIILTAYFLDSQENLVISMIVFLVWVEVQYMASLSSGGDFGEGIIFGFILLYLSIGALLYGLVLLHSSLKHRFTNVYRFWTVFYFIMIFYTLSFQSSLPMISEYSFEAGAFSFFLILLIILCFFSFIIGLLVAASKNSISFKEVIGFVIAILVILTLVLSTKAGAGLVGYCYLKNCGEFQTSAECASAPNPLLCEWATPRENEFQQAYCREMNCYNYQTEEECNSTSDKIECSWMNNRCVGSRASSPYYDNYKTCEKYNNQKENCLGQELCSWRASYNMGFRNKLPTSLWFLWLVNNVVFIGFIIVIIGYGQSVSSTKIINLGLLAFIIEILSRYIGFWFDFSGYFMFSILAILGGILLILGGIFIPKWRRKLLNEEKGRF